MRVLTAGESHGPVLTAIIEGFPAGVKVDVNKINEALKLRQQGYGRGKRMQIETDKVIILSGIRDNLTIGSPITLQIKNKDYDNWQKIMNSANNDKLSQKKREVLKPRPGHADLVGGQKRKFNDLRNVLERSSARETAISVAVGALCEELLNELGVNIYSYVSQIGKIICNKHLDNVSYEKINESEVRMLSIKKSKEAYNLIDKAKQLGTTIGGKFTIEVHNLPAGLGDYIQWDRKIDSLLASAILGINAVKSIEFGDCDKMLTEFGSEVMDEIIIKNNKITRKSNHLGGIEGGMTNGMPIIISGVMKPIPTQYHPLQTIDIKTKEVKLASVERSDICAVPACSIVAHYIVSKVIADVILKQFDYASFERLKEQWDNYRKEIENY